MVREPVRRAYSHHRMYRRFVAGGWKPDFEIRDFATDVRDELARYERGERTEYVGPGAYAEGLERWTAVYGSDRIKLVVMEDLADPRLAPRVMRELEAYLELPHHDYGDILARRFNHAATPSEVPETERRLLAEFYRPYNDRLRGLLGRDLEVWD
ncbi:MAG: hypothetical protein LC685_02285 [Actinobacteria bacterium]|nr:hypothetical protein [Actinomycetota bacterium]